MPTALRYGIASAAIRFLRRSAMRSIPISAAAVSIRRSRAKVTSGRPELRYGLVDIVFVNTARLRSAAAGMSYGPVISPDPFDSGESETQCAPTLLKLEA